MLGQEHFKVLIKNLPSRKKCEVFELRVLYVTGEKITVDWANISTLS